MYLHDIIRQNKGEVPLSKLTSVLQHLPSVGPK